MEFPLFSVWFGELVHHISLLVSVVFTASKMKAAFKYCLEKTQALACFYSFICNNYCYHSLMCIFSPNHNELRHRVRQKSGVFFSSRQFCEANGSNLSHFLVSKDFICPQDDFRVPIIPYLEAKMLHSKPCFHFYM